MLDSSCAMASALGRGATHAQQCRLETAFASRLVAGRGSYNGEFSTASERGPATQAWPCTGPE